MLWRGGLRRDAKRGRGVQESAGSCISLMLTFCFFLLEFDTLRLQGALVDANMVLCIPPLSRESPFGRPRGLWRYGVYMYMYMIVCTCIISLCTKCTTCYCNILSIGLRGPPRLTPAGPRGPVRGNSNNSTNSNNSNNSSTNSNITR